MVLDEKSEPIVCGDISLKSTNVNLMVAAEDKVIVVEMFQSGLKCQTAMEHLGAKKLQKSSFAHP